MKKLNKAQFAWAFYDWANSVYSLVITTAIFPIYFGTVLSDIIASGEDVYLFGIRFSSPDILYSYSISFSFLVVVLISPILSSIADQIGNKKKFLQIFAWLGALSCASLFWFRGADTLGIGIVGSVLASVGFWGSLVFYNAYLPEITDKENQDALSAKGFIYGYLGSSILLILCLVMIMAIDVSLTRYSFLLVAVWWIGFAQITFKNLPKSYSQPISKVSNTKKAHRELLKVGKELFQYRKLKFFILSFFMLSVGIQTIIYMASRFGSEVLKLDSGKLILTILCIQFAAILGAYLIIKLAKKIGNIRTLYIGLSVWSLICVTAYILDKNDVWIEYEFYAMGIMLGMVLGGVQSLTRSTYSKMLPDTRDHTIYFSFYDIVEKIALILGSFVFAQVQVITGSMQSAALVMALFFVVAIFLLTQLNRRQPTNE